MSLYLIDGVEFQLEAEQAECLRAKGILLEEVTWTTQTTEQFKIYTCQSFLDAANEYYNKSPPDLIQSAEKLWLGAAYSVKLIFLKLRVNINSHNAMKAAIEFIVTKSSIPKETAVTMIAGWRSAERLHSFSNGGSFPKEVFDEKKQDVEYFVAKMGGVDINELRPHLQNFLSALPRGIGWRAERGAVNMSGDWHQYDTVLF